jgi:hypothetical protein
MFGGYSGPISVPVGSVTALPVSAGLGCQCRADHISINLYFNKKPGWSKTSRVVNFIKKIQTPLGL